MGGHGILDKAVFAAHVADLSDIRPGASRWRGSVFAEPLDYESTGLSPQVSVARPTAKHAWRSFMTLSQPSGPALPPVVLDVR